MQWMENVDPVKPDNTGQKVKVSTSQQIRCQNDRWHHNVIFPNFFFLFLTDSNLTNENRVIFINNDYYRAKSQHEHNWWWHSLLFTLNHTRKPFNTFTLQHIFNISFSLCSVLRRSSDTHTRMHAIRLKSCLWNAISMKSECIFKWLLSLAYINKRV